VLIVKLRESGNGCIVNNQYVGRVVYADDTVILSRTIHGLQHMFNTCCEIVILTDGVQNENDNDNVWITQFAVSEPRLWNDLPPTLRSSYTAHGQFQGRLKTTLFRLAYGCNLGAFVNV